MVLYGIFLASSAKSMVHKLYSDEEIVHLVLYNLALSAVLGFPLLMFLAEGQATMTVRQTHNPNQHHLPQHQPPYRYL